MKYLKKFNESIEVEGFELSSHEERNRTRSIFNSLSFTDEELKQISLVMGNKWFNGGGRELCINKGEKQIYFYKYDDNWYYVIYYEGYNSNALIYKCSEFEGLINCLHYIVKNYG